MAHAPDHAYFLRPHGYSYPEILNLSDPPVIVF